MEAPIATAGVVVFEHDTVLLVEHGAGAGHITGAWGIPAGGIDEGETERDAAVRELLEETGLQVDHASLVELPTSYAARIPRKSGINAWFTVRVFAATAHRGTLGASAEGAPQWIARADVPNLPQLLPNTVEIVEAAAAAVAARRL